MKKFFVLVLLVSLLNSVSAIDVNLSRNNLRLNNTATTTSFTASLNDNVDDLTGTGTIPAKLKIKAKGVSASTSTIEIPYVDGVIGSSDEVTLTLLGDVAKSSTAKLMIKFPKKYKKKYNINNYSSTVSVDADAVKLSGKITIPAGNLNSFRSRTRKKLTRMRDRGVTPFNTENPEGVLVELVQIEPETGELVADPENPGEPLVIATAFTDAGGDFEMDMPEETPGGDPVDFGTEFVIMVQGDEEGEEMHAPLFSDEVDVNPATEVLFDLTQEAIGDPEMIGLPEDQELSFDNFTDQEAEQLDQQMEELSPLYEETLAESLASLKDSYSEFLNKMLGYAADDDTLGEETDLQEVAKGIAGDYNVVFFDTRITSEERVDLSVNLAVGRMFKPDEVGALIVKPLPGFMTQASLFGNRGYEGPENDEGPNDDFGDGPGDNNQCEGGQCQDDNQCEGGDCLDDDQDDNQDDSQDDNQGGQGSTLTFSTRSGGGDDFSCYEIEAESQVEEKSRDADASGNFYMTVDGNRIISFAEPAFEESHENPDGTYIFRSQPSVMNMIPVGDDMFLSRSQNTGYNQGPDQTKEYEYTVGYGSIIKKSDLEASDLDGTYGMVGLGYSVEGSSYGATAFVGDLIFNGDTTINYNLAQTEIKLKNISCDGSSYAVEVSDESITGGASLSFSKDRVNIELDDENSKTPPLFTGFADSDAEILTMAYASDEGVQGSRNGRNVISAAERQMIFAVRKPSSQLNLDGKSYRLLSVRYSFNSEGGRTIESGEVGTLSFSGGTASISGFTKTAYARATGSSESVDTSTSVTDEAAIAYTLGATGNIGFTIGEDEEITGFVSSSTELIVLNSDYGNSLGMYLAILQE